MSRARQAWAIHTQSPEGHGYIGTGYLLDWDKPPVQCQGLTIALFATRKAAREALVRIKGPAWGWKNARVYRVSIAISGHPA